MPRPKGLPKTGGRVKGTPNKVKIEVKLKIADFIISNFADFVKAWKNLPPDSPVKHNTYVNLIKYVVAPEQPDSSEDKTQSEISSAIAKSIADADLINKEE